MKLLKKLSQWIESFLESDTRALQEEWEQLRMQGILEDEE